MHSLAETQLKITLSLISVVSGITLNSWLVSVNIRDWRRGVRLSPCDQILSLMALINIVMQSVLSLDMFLSEFPYLKGFNETHLIFLCVLIFLVSCTMWLTAWLSIYYCMRIVTFTREFLLVVKMRISGLIPKLLVASAVESFFLAIPSLWNISAETIHVIVRNTTYISTHDYRNVTVNVPYRVTAFVGCTLPLVLTQIPIGLTLVSLWRHTHRMKMNQSDSYRPQRQAHVTAARTMILLVTFHTAFHGSSISLMSFSFNNVDLSMALCWYFVLFYPTIQSFVIITGNSKLWKATKGILSHPGVMCNVVPTVQDRI